MHHGPVYYANRLRTYTDPRVTEPFEPWRHATVTSELYDGRTVTVPVWAIARADGYICVRQTVGPEQYWNAWVPADRVRPR